MLVNVEMFIRIWHVSSNVGSDDPTIEEYAAIRSITRFYSKRYEGEAENRYLVVVSGVTASSYVTKETFEFLKSVHDRNLIRDVEERKVGIDPSKAVTMGRVGADD